MVAEHRAIEQSQERKRRREASEPEPDTPDRGRRILSFEASTARSEAEQRVVDIENILYVDGPTYGRKR